MATSNFKELTIGKLISSNRERFQLKASNKLFTASISGKLRRQISRGEAEFPVVGDEVQIEQNQADIKMIQHVLPRRNYFSRQFSGLYIGEQIIASNLDYVFIVMGLDKDFNMKRLDRYLVMAAQGGVCPVVVLTKSDLCSDIWSYVARTRYERADELKVVAVSVKDKWGLEELNQFIDKEQSILLVGSSGAGKSSLINYSVGQDVARTNELSEGNGRGQCTTTMTQGYFTQSGALLIDASGLREIQLWTDTQNLNSAFEDIGELASTCKFTSCKHQGESGCKVREALLNGDLTQERFLNYMKLKSEVFQSKEEMLAKKRQRSKAIAIKNKNEKVRKKYEP